jgi:hypothetical protein
VDEAVKLFGSRLEMSLASQEGDAVGGEENDVGGLERDAGRERLKVELCRRKLGLLSS